MLDCFPKERVPYEMAQQVFEFQFTLVLECSEEGERLEGEEITLMPSLGASRHSCFWIAQGIGAFDTVSAGP